MAAQRTVDPPARVRFSPIALNPFTKSINGKEIKDYIGSVPSSPNVDKTTNKGGLNMEDLQISSDCIHCSTKECFTK